MTVDDRQRLWVAVYAISAFEKAEKNCHLLLATCGDNRHPLFEPLSTSVHIFYARPFRRVQGIKRTALFHDADVPQDYRGVHSFLVSFRDKIVAHTDADTEEDFGSEMHDVQVRPVPGDMVLSCCDPTARLEAYTDARPIIAEMKRVAMRRFLAIKQQYLSAFPTESADYVLQLEGDEIFKRQ
jgi:hypothetical protein